MNPQSIKIKTPEEAKVCVGSLKAFGLAHWTNDFSHKDQIETLWFDGVGTFWFVSNSHQRVEDQKEFDNWKDFAAEILKEYTCKANSDAEKLWLIDALNIKGCSQPLHTEGFPYCCYNYRKFSFYCEGLNKPQKTIAQIKTLLNPMKKEPLVLKISNAAEAEEYSNTLKELGVPFDKFLLYQSTWGVSPSDFLMMRDDCFFVHNLPHSHYLCEDFDEFLNKLPQKYKKNMKTKEHQITITTQEAAYICAILNNRGNRENALREQGCEFMLEFEEDNWFEVWKKFNNIFEKDKKGIWNNYNCQYLFKPQIKEFTFSNGLETKTETSGDVSIGCMKKSKTTWVAEANSIIILDLQEVKKEGYSFTLKDIEGFRSWLIGERLFA